MGNILKKFMYENEEEEKMSCIEVLRNWEENIEALEMLEALIQYGEEMPSEELLEEIYVDGFCRI